MSDCFFFQSSSMYLRVSAAFSTVHDKTSFSSAKRPSERKPHKFLAEQEHSAIINKL
jgi:hypothetical protein